MTRWLRPTQAVDVLVVCTGNICRSPYVAARLQHALPEIRVESAGIQAVVGELPNELVRRALAERGLNQPEFPPARIVTRRIVHQARLIITATTAQRAWLSRLDKSTVNRAFTLKELARILAPETVGRGVEGVRQVADAAAKSSGRDFDDDLDDPYGLEWPAYATMADDVDRALTVLVPALREANETA